MLPRHPGDRSSPFLVDRDRRRCVQGRQAVQGSCPGGTAGVVQCVGQKAVAVHRHGQYRQAQVPGHGQDGRVGRRLGQQRVAGARRGHQRRQQPVLCAACQDYVVARRVETRPCYPGGAGFGVALEITPGLEVETGPDAGRCPQCVERPGEGGRTRADERQVEREIDRSVVRAPGLRPGFRQRQGSRGPHEGSPPDFTGNEAAAPRFGVRAAHGVERHAEPVREIPLRRQPLTLAQAAVTNALADRVGDAQVSRAGPALEVRYPVCHGDNIFIDSIIAPKISYQFKRKSIQKCLQR